MPIWVGQTLLRSNLRSWKIHFSWNILSGKYHKDHGVQLLASSRCAGIKFLGTLHTFPGRCWCWFWHREPRNSSWNFCWALAWGRQDKTWDFLAVLPPWPWFGGMCLVLVVPAPSSRHSQVCFVPWLSPQVLPGVLPFAVCISLLLNLCFPTDLEVGILFIPGLCLY